MSSRLEADQNALYSVHKHSNSLYVAVSTALISAGIFLPSVVTGSIPSVKVSTNSGISTHGATGKGRMEQGTNN